MKIEKVPGTNELGHLKQNSQKKVLVQQNQQRTKLYSGRIYIPTIQEFAPDRCFREL